jgi:hypothetical protein
LEGAPKLTHLCDFEFFLAAITPPIAPPMIPPMTRIMIMMINQNSLWLTSNLRREAAGATAGGGHPVSRELLVLLAKNSEADMDLDFAEHTGPGEPQVALCYLRCEEGVGRPEAPRYLVDSVHCRRLPCLNNHLLSVSGPTF